MFLSQKWWIPLGIGAVAGVINGLFGAGGGLLLVPLFMRVCRLSPKEAFATSLCVMVVLSAVSFAVYLSRGHVDLAMAWPYAVGGMIGGIGGGLLMGRINVRWLRLGLAAFLLYGGIKAVMLW